jgi:hypothetical protein
MDAHQHDRLSISLMPIPVEALSEQSYSSRLVFLLFCMIIDPVNVGITSSACRGFDHFYGRPMVLIGDHRHRLQQAQANGLFRLYQAYGMLLINICNRFIICIGSHRMHKS